MRTFFQLSLVLGLISCSSSSLGSKTKLAATLSTKPESGVYNVKHKGSEYQVSLETAESQAFQALSAQQTSFLVDTAENGIIADRIVLFADVYMQVNPKYLNEGTRVLLNGKNFSYQIDKKLLDNAKTSYQVSCVSSRQANAADNTAKATLNSKNLSSFLQNGSLELKYLSL